MTLPPSRHQRRVDVKRALRSRTSSLAGSAGRPTGLGLSRLRLLAVAACLPLLVRGPVVDATAAVDPVAVRASGSPGRGAALSVRLLGADSASESGSLSERRRTHRVPRRRRSAVSRSGDLQYALRGGDVPARGLPSPAAESPVPSWVTVPSCRRPTRHGAVSQSLTDLFPSLDAVSSATGVWPSNERFASCTLSGVIRASLSGPRTSGQSSDSRLLDRRCAGPARSGGFERPAVEQQHSANDGRSAVR